MSRDDLVKTNAGIVRSVASEISASRAQGDHRHGLESARRDVLRRHEGTGFPRERVIGMAGVLDTARYRMFLAEALDVSVEDIQAMVLGGHGDTMVPLISYTTVSRHPGHASSSTRRSSTPSSTARATAAPRSWRYLKTGSAYYAPSAAAVQMVEAIVLDKKRILPCSAWLQGEYGMRDVFRGVPCKLGRNGLEKIIEISSTDDERAELHKSAEAVRRRRPMVDAVVTGDAP